MNRISPEDRANVEELIRVIREHLPDLRERYGVESLGIFGSYVRGEQREDSDLNVLVEFFRTPDLFEFVALKHELSDILGINVDLVMKDALKPRIGKRILQEVIQV